MSRSTTDIFACSAGQLRALLALAVDERSEYGSLLARAKQVDAMELLLAEALGTPDAAKQMLADVRNRSTSIEALREIRDRAKALIGDRISDASREAASFVYHAATAAALGRHGINLSSVLPQSRLRLYEDLASVLATDPLAKVFREAADYVSEAQST